MTAATVRAGSTRPSAAARAVRCPAGAALAALLLVASCAPGPGGAQVTRRSRAGDRDAPSDPAARSTLAAPGIECVRWFLPIDPAVRRDGIAAILEAPESGAPLASRVESPLSSNGLTLLRIDSRRLADVLAQLGDSPVARRTMLGQTDAWADLASVNLVKGRALLLAGRPQVAEDALYRLGLRGWCFPTVEGAAARIELRISLESMRMAKISIDPSQVRSRGSDIRNGLATLELGPDEALLVLETPLVPPETEGGDGPDALPPPTLGALFLDGTAFPDRATALVILPTFADMLPASGVASTKPGAPSTR